MSRKPEIQNVCPECGHPFHGDGFDGIDAHGRAGHEYVMPYGDAWPLIRAGAYSRPTRSIEALCGCLAQRDGPKPIIEEIKENTEMCWAGEFEKVDGFVARRKS